MQKLNGSVESLIPPERLMGTVMIVELLKATITLALNFYEEIDFVSYMDHSHLIDQGEMDYSKVMVCGGPLVYPAVHTYIQLFIYKYLADNGVYYRPAQVVGLLVYMISVY